MIIARSVFAAVQHERIIMHLLGLIGNEESFSLFGNYVANLAFLCLEVIGEFFGLIAIISILEDR